MGQASRAPSSPKETLVEELAVGDQLGQRGLEVTDVGDDVGGDVGGSSLSTFFWKSFLRIAIPVS